MVLIVVGVVVGIILGSMWFDSDGWMIGAFLGALTGMIFKQAKQIGLLESRLKTFAEDQAAIKQQLALLKKPSASSFAKSENSQPETERKLPIEMRSESPEQSPIIISKPQQILATSSAELELPDQDLEAIALSKAAPDDLKIPPKNVARPQPTPTRTSEPRKPDLGDKIASAVRRFFTEGNPIVRIGMVVMFFGVSFLVKYASGQGLFPIEFRLAGVVIGAIALLVFGWKTRLREDAYGLVLQGGGIAIIYLTLFAAAKIYGLIPLGVAFGLLFLVVMLGVLLALLQNAQVLAILATAGGFLAPILTSSGSGSHVGLFTFYLILNIGILSIAIYKSWRLLNWVGFMFTFVIASAWGILRYDPIFYSSTQPFLLAFFVLYLAVSILFSLKQPTNLKGMVDGSLVFGLPLVAFGLQTLLLKQTEYGLAISAVVLATIYILLAVGLARRHLQSHRVLIESFLALGVSFATLAVPLALNASWTSVTWALEATGLVWVGLRQARLRARVVGYLLHCASVISLFVFEGVNTGPAPIISGDFLGLTLLAISSVIIAYFLHTFISILRNLERIIVPIAMSLGILWWFVAGLNEINAHILREQIFAVSVLFAVLTAIVFLLTSKKLEWSLLSNSVFALLPFMVLLSLFAGLEMSNVHPTQGFSLIAIGFFFVVQYRFFFMREQSFAKMSEQSRLLGWWHIFSAWYLFLLIFWEVSWQKDSLNLSGTAELMIWFVAIAAPVIFLIAAGQKKFWPFASFEKDYKNWIPAPLFLLAAFWFDIASEKTVEAEHYLPLLNPLDLAQFAAVLIFAYAAKREFMNQVSFITNTVRLSVVGILLFLWLNIVTLRAVSHYQHIDYTFDALWNSMQVQMALSILWSICALIIMNFSRRVQRRELWMVGAGLLALVVLKLATKDLAGSDSLARVISFTVVGALMLLIGFLSPIPAKKVVSGTNVGEDDDSAIKAVPLDTKAAVHE